MFYSSTSSARASSVGYLARRNTIGHFRVGVGAWSGSAIEQLRWRQRGEVFCR